MRGKKKTDRVNEEILSRIIWIHPPSPPDNELLFPWTLKKQLIHNEKVKNVPPASIHNGKTKKKNCFKCRAKDNKFSDASN